MTIESVEELLLQMSEEEPWSGGVQMETHLSAYLLKGRIVSDHLYRWDDVPEDEEED